MSSDGRKKIAVIGGGVAGLVAARHLCDPAWRVDPILFEQTGSLGGTWVYSDRSGQDEFGLPVHSSMYKSLRTNLPKEAMMFPDFPHTKQGVSYLTAKEVLQYLNDYADHFHIRKCVKYYHHVQEVKPVGSQWKIRTRDLKAKEDRIYIFDAVIIANGHNSKPKFPSLEGIKFFKGKTFHSHDYRDSAPFRRQKVLVIGAGPSGLDLTFEIASVTDTVVLSHHTSYAGKVGFPDHVVLKPDVERILENGNVLFRDGTRMEFDVIAYCTGYEYTYPFLSPDCGISTTDNYVDPLYKSIINVNHPTMAFLAVLRHTPTFYLTDLQVRFFLATVHNRILLPSKSEMLESVREDERRKMANGSRRCDFFVLGDDNADYMKELSRIAGVPPMPHILLRIYFHGYERIFSDFKNFRHNFYKIIDQEKFSVVDLRKSLVKPVERIHSNPSCRCGALVQERKTKT